MLEEKKDTVKELNYIKTGVMKNSILRFTKIKVLKSSVTYPSLFSSPAFPETRVFFFWPNYVVEGFLVFYVCVFEVFPCCFRKSETATYKITKRNDRKNSQSVP